MASLSFNSYHQVAITAGGSDRVFAVEVYEEEIVWLKLNLVMN